MSVVFSLVLSYGWPNGRPGISRPGHRCPRRRRMPPIDVPRFLRAEAPPIPQHHREPRDLLIQNMIFIVFPAKLKAFRSEAALAIGRVPSMRLSPIAPHATAPPTTLIQLLLNLIPYPYTLHPPPYALNPKPYALHPKPWALTSHTLPSNP